jgi:hypothetical protein
MQSKLERPDLYADFIGKNELQIRNDLDFSTAHECINLLHKYAGFLHQGILHKDLTRIESSYESIQTILEIYYEKVKRK